DGPGPGGGGGGEAPARFVSEGGEMIRFRLCSVLGLASVLAALAPGESGQKGGKGKDDGRHDPARAVANLDVHKDLRATLFASEPTLTNPTNLDVDHPGPGSVCDVMNY